MKLDRDIFESTIIKSGLNSKDIFDTITPIVSNQLVDDISINIDDIIEYAQLRLSLGEYAKSVYYCYYGISQSPGNIQKEKLLNNIIECLDFLILEDQNDSIEQNVEQKSGNPLPLIQLIKSTKIDTISLTSYGARMQSSMPGVDAITQHQIYQKYEKYLSQGEFQNAFYEIYFLFTNKYLKLHTSTDKPLIEEFKRFCILRSKNILK